VTNPTRDAAICLPISCVNVSFLNRPPLVTGCEAVWSNLFVLAKIGKGNRETAGMYRSVAREAGPLLQRHSCWIMPTWRVAHIAAELGIRPLSLRRSFRHPTYRIAGLLRGRKLSASEMTAVSPTAPFVTQENCAAVR
jgi:hypothetical protein